MEYVFENEIFSMLSICKIRKLLRIDVHQHLEQTVNMHADLGVTYRSTIYNKSYSVNISIESGIERHHYIPKNKTKKRVILFQHGMWHGAWCWKYWQQYFAEQGWESIAYSLPGHSKSMEQLKVSEAGLGYYLFFLNEEIKRLEHKPIVIAHSMGGALSQWYLKYIGDLPAVVFVASWTSHDVLKDCVVNAAKIDPLGALLVPLFGKKMQFRSSSIVKKWFLSDYSIMSPYDLKSHLTEESEIVLFQHRPKYWSPPKKVNTPLLWLTAEMDAIIPKEKSMQSAHFYNAEHKLIADVNHDIMLEKSSLETAKLINDWLINESNCLSIN